MPFVANLLLANFTELFTLIFYYFAGYGHNLIVDMLRGTTEHREAMSELMHSQPKTPEPLAAEMLLEHSLRATNDMLQLRATTETFIPHK